MRILFNNEIVSATLSSDHANVLYPVSNINHVFLKKIYKSTETSDVITAIFSETKNINCIYFGFTNALSMTLRLYDVSDGLIATKVLTSDKYSQIFATISGVKYVTITLSASELVYVGTIAVGESFTMPNPLNDVIKDYQDNSLTNESLDGQYTMNKIQWLKKVVSSHFVFNIDDYNEIFELFADNVRPVWVDFFENTTNALNAIYARIELSSLSKNDRLYSFKITSREVR